MLYVLLAVLRVIPPVVLPVALDIVCKMEEYAQVHNSQIVLHVAKQIVVLCCDLNRRSST